jgi:hypothetical protein
MKVQYYGKDLNQMAFDQNLFLGQAKSPCDVHFATINQSNSRDVNKNQFSFCNLFTCKRLLLSFFMIANKKELRMM